MRTLAPTDHDYPIALRSFPHPAPITVSRLLPRGNGIAIVGTRKPSEGARAFAYTLAQAVAAAGGVVVSGGALGIDAAAHEGALAAGGCTVAVVATGKNHTFPPQHAGLYERIAASEGAMVWPFPADAEARTPHFLRRNGLLVALSSAVVVVQAGKGSGALNAASWARRLGRRVWVVPQAPWSAAGFEGSLGELDRGARPLTSVPSFLKAEALADKTSLSLPFREVVAPLDTFDLEVEPGAHRALLKVLDREPRHRDELAEAAGLTSSQVTTALLTLTLENVVEEGPLGFFSRVGK